MARGSRQHGGNPQSPRGTVEPSSSPAPTSVQDAKAQLLNLIAEAVEHGVERGFDTALEQVSHRVAAPVGGPGVQAETVIVDQLTPDLLAKSWEWEDRQNARQADLEKHRRNNFAWVCGGAACFLFAVCWLFLYFQKPELLHQILLPVLTFGGGLLAGRSIRSDKTEVAKDSEQGD